MKTRRQLLEALVGDADIVPVLRAPDADGRKRIAPIPVTPELRELLIGYHLTGFFPPLCAVTKEGRRYNVYDAIAIGSYAVQKTDEGNFCRWICIDIDGEAGHARGLSDDGVARACDEAYKLLAEAGLRPFIETSSGGQGRHVWSLFSEPIEAGYVRWLAAKIGDRVSIAAGMEVEAFPKNAFPSGPGSLVALPSGANYSERGGQIYRSDAGLAIAGATKGDVLTWINVYRSDRAQHERQCEIRGRRHRFDRVDGEGVADRLSMEAIAYELGVVTDESPAGLLQMDCPRHRSRSKKSLHVEPEKGVWYCHGCGKGGGARGSGAGVYSLAQWLLPDGMTAHEVFEELEALERRLCVGARHD
ncbi:MAG: hypothetical protein PF961_10725 [Planctomycetota bacterium]|jgi:hypothetical protein|nr:hypothetical protein [Planctomycetota bacterium]